ncbi:hypothetical protein ACTA71_005034 [Dictyostelium dimigraforme]
MSKVYSKSQTVSPGKPQNIFVTALPSSVSAPSLLSLQKPNNGAGSHRKQRQNSGSSKNRPNPPVEQIKSTERKNSGNKYNNNSNNNNSNNKNRKYSKNNSNVNSSSNINSSSIMIKCEEQHQDGYLKSQEFPNLFKNKLYLKDDISSPSSSSSTSSPSCLSSSSCSTFSQSEVDENKYDTTTTTTTTTNNINNNTNNNTNENIEEKRTEEPSIEEETFIESSFEETKDIVEEPPFEEQFEILPISIGEETLKEYTSFLSVLSELIVDMYYDDDKSPTSSQSSAPSSPKPIKNNNNNNNNDTNTTTTTKMATSSLSTIEKFQVFNVDQIPEISIEAYIERVFKYLPFGTDIFIFSTIYLDRLIQWNREIQISPLNIHRLFMASIIVASKFHNDKALNNRYYAQVGGISLFEMNQLEIHFLLLLNWKLHIDPEIFEAFKTSIQSKIGILDMKIRKLSSINDGNVNKENGVIKTTEEKIKNHQVCENSNNDCNNNNNNNDVNNNNNNNNNDDNDVNNNNNNNNATATTTTTISTTTQPTIKTTNNNNNCNNSTKRYVTLVETDKNNSKPKSKYNSSKSINGSTSQFSRILNNRGSKNVSYHHPNYLTYPLAAPQQPQQPTYYQPPQQQQYYQQQQQYYSNYQFNQQLSYYQQQQQHYDDYYQRHQIPIPPHTQSQNYIYQQPYHSSSSTSSSNIYIGKSGTPPTPNMNDIGGGIGESYDSLIPSSFESSNGCGSVGSCTTSSSIGSTTGSASQYQPHSWQNAYYYGGVATPSQFSYHTPTYH